MVEYGVPTLLMKLVEKGEIRIYRLNCTNSDSSIFVLQGEYFAFIRKKSK